MHFLPEDSHGFLLITWEHHPLERSPQLNRSFGTTLVVRLSPWLTVCLLKMYWGRFFHLLLLRDAKCVACTFPVVAFCVAGSVLPYPCSEHEALWYQGFEHHFTTSLPILGNVAFLTVIYETTVHHKTSVSYSVKYRNLSSLSIFT